MTKKSNPEGGPVGNKKAQKHGGAAAVMRIHDGQPFTGLARAKELEIRDQLAQVGRSEIVLETAIRLQTATNLYWDAAVKALEGGDISVLERYIDRFGWLASASLRAWAQVKQEQGSKPGVTAEMILATIKDAKNDKTDDRTD